MMNNIVKELRDAAARITDAADKLEQEFGAPSEEVSAPTLKLEDVRAVLVDISRKGYTEEVRKLLRKYGADRLSQVDTASYHALMKDAEELRDE